MGTENSSLFSSLEPQRTTASNPAGSAQGLVSPAWKDLKVKATEGPDLTVLYFLVRFYAPLALHLLPAILMPKAEHTTDPSLLILLKKHPDSVADWFSSH